MNSGLTFKDGPLRSTPAMRGFAVCLAGSADGANSFVQEALTKAWANQDRARPAPISRPNSSPSCAIPLIRISGAGAARLSTSMRFSRLALPSTATSSLTWTWQIRDPLCSAFRPSKGKRSRANDFAPGPNWKQSSTGGLGEAVTLGGPARLLIEEGVEWSAKGW
jgi:hypothetical protein